MRRLSLGLITLGSLLSFVPALGLGNTNASVVVIPIHGTIDTGMEHLVERAVTQARDGIRKRCGLEAVSGDNGRGVLLAREAPEHFQNHVAGGGI